MDKGASRSATGLAAPEGAEPPSRLGPTDGIPSAARFAELAERVAAYNPFLSPDNRADEAPLNTDIHEALGNCVHRETEYYCIEDGNDYDSGFTCKACRRDMYGNRAIPAYVRSIDDALTLLPKGGEITMLDLTLSWEPDPKGAGPAGAESDGDAHPEKGDS